jgi:excisionase family DNA binding protein
VIVEQLRHNADEIECVLEPRVRSEAEILATVLDGEASAGHVVRGGVESMPVDTNMASVPRLLTVHEAADVLGVCTETVRRAIWRGDLVSTRIGRSVRVRVDDLRLYLDSRRGVRV